VSDALAIKPDSNKVITVPLMSIPAVANGSYELLAQVTDSKGGMTDAVGSTYTLAAPFLSLVPSAATVVVAKSGTASISFSLANNGNIPSAGASTITVLASATPVYSEPMKLVISPEKTHVVKLKLTAAQVITLQAAAFVILEVTDPLGGIETLTVTGL
jgi:hypothetical protein